MLHQIEFKHQGHVFQLIEPPSVARLKALRSLWPSASVPTERSPPTYIYPYTLHTYNIYIRIYRPDRTPTSIPIYRAERSPYLSLYLYVAGQIGSPYVSPTGMCLTYIATDASRSPVSIPTPGDIDRSQTYMPICDSPPTSQKSIPTHVISPPHLSLYAIRPPNLSLYVIRPPNLSLPRGALIGPSHLCDRPHTSISTFDRSPKSFPIR